MAVDTRLFKDFENGKIPPTFRIYSWSQPAVTYGRRINPEKFFNLEELRRSGQTIARRPTGGGIVFHQPGELTFAGALPRKNHFYKDTILDSYFFISKIILNFLKNLGLEVQLDQKNFKKRKKINHHLCFKEAAPFEITLNGKKILGLSQARQARSFCFQGTLKEIPDFPQIQEKLADFLTLQTI